MFILTAHCVCTLKNLGSCGMIEHDSVLCTGWIGKWSNFVAESQGIFEYPGADFQVKHDPIHIHQLRCLAISWMMTQTFTNGEWLEITISIHEQNWLFSDQTFQISKMEVQKLVFFFKGVVLLKTLLNQTGSPRVHYQQNTHRFKKKILSGKLVFRCKLRELITLNFWPCLKKKKIVLPTSFNRFVGQPEGILEMMNWWYERKKSHTGHTSSPEFGGILK